jgi:translation initiation factor IF-3
MDFGKSQYEKQKQERHQKHAPVPKSIRFSYRIDPHDVEVKRKQINDFLAKGHRVTLNMEVRGRERYLGGAKEKFFQLVTSFSSTATLADIKENASKGFSFTLNPGTK